jgi:lysozyme
MQSKNASNVNVIDVSHHQGDIEWLKVKAAGVKGAFVKATEGATYTDPKYRRNAAGAAGASVPVGYYHYARPENNEVMKEVENFISAIKGQPAQLPHVLDLEGDASKLSKPDLTKWALTWMREVKKRTGHTVMLYTGAYFARDEVGPELGEFPLWIAHYGASKPLDNSTWSRWEVFQYTSSGKVDGIAGNVDMNVMELDAFDKYTKAVVPVEVEKPLFSDVSANHWARTSVEKAARCGVIAGVAPGVFGLGQTITREQLAVILDRLGLLE